MIMQQMNEVKNYNNMQSNSCDRCDLPTAAYILAEGFWLCHKCALRYFQNFSNCESHELPKNFDANEDKQLKICRECAKDSLQSLNGQNAVRNLSEAEAQYESVNKNIDVKNTFDEWKKNLTKELMKER